MLAYLGAVWKYRYFWLSLVRMDLRARYRRSVLGVGWSLLHPLAMTTILCIAFSTLFKVDITFYAPFLMVGLTSWNYLVQVAQHGGLCFQTAEAYIRQCPIPLAIYPLRATLSCGFHFLIALSLATGLAVVLRGLPSPLALLGLLPALVLLGLVGWGMATVLGLLTVRFRDLTHMIELAFQALFYLTPIIYEPRMLKDRGMDWLLHVNPVVPFVELLRQPILYGQFAPAGTYLTAALIALGALGAAVALLRREERRLIFLL